ncbi:hypothetical protein Bca4012_034419 [Brassica carinata]
MMKDLSNVHLLKFLLTPRLETATSLSSRTVPTRVRVVVLVRQSLVVHRMSHPLSAEGSCLGKRSTSRTVEAGLLPPPGQTEGSVVAGSFKSDTKVPSGRLWNGSNQCNSRHRVCGMHSKTPKVIVAGIEQRFCQQCSRFHQLPEFDLEKRSCRRRLAGHNERRRKPQPASLSVLSSRYGRIAPSLYEAGACCASHQGRY